MCRHDLTKTFEPKIDTVKQAEVEKKFPKEFAVRKSRLQKAGKWMIGRKKITLLIGNTAQMKAKAEPGKKQFWDWQMYVKVKEGNESEFIKSV